MIPINKNNRRFRASMSRFLEYSAVTQASLKKIQIRNLERKISPANIAANIAANIFVTLLYPFILFVASPIAFFLEEILHSKSKIQKAPGLSLNTFAQSFYSKKTYERVFQQWIIDWREEHAEALSRKQFNLARWRHLSGYVVFVSMMITHAGSTGLRGILKIWRLTGGG